MNARSAGLPEQALGSLSSLGLDGRLFRAAAAPAIAQALIDALRNGVAVL